jgi:hypothetical protein
MLSKADKQTGAIATRLSGAKRPQRLKRQPGGAAADTRHRIGGFQFDWSVDLFQAGAERAIVIAGHDTVSSTFNRWRNAMYRTILTALAGTLLLIGQVDASQARHAHQNSYEGTYALTPTRQVHQRFLYAIDRPAEPEKLIKVAGGAGIDG